MNLLNEFSCFERRNAWLWFDFRNHNFNFELFLESLQISNQLGTIKPNLSIKIKI